MRTARSSLRTRLAAIALAGFALAATAPASATTVLKLDVPEMTALSQWVVKARVVQLQNVDLRAKGEGLFTDVDLVISEVYAGDEVPGRYTLRMMGGVGDDGMALMIPGMPRFEVGETVVLFLEPTSMGHVPCGLGQGVWRVLPGPFGQEWVRQSAQGLHMMARDTNGRLIAAPPAPQLTTAKTLGELIVEIYAAQLAPATRP